MNIVITGASRGIGFETAIFLARDEANTVIALSRNETGLAALKLAASAGNIHTYCIDLTRHSIEELRAVLAEYGGVDILINNAGQLINKRFEDASVDEWRVVFEANVFGVVKMVQAALPFLKKSATPHIVNIGSMGGVQGTSKFHGLSAYSASKAAICNLTECLAEELKEYNIKVNCLALGAVNTEMLKNAFPGYEAPLAASEMAAFVADFSLRSHRYINGKIIPVSLSTP
jgi:NAD(P)-dependent dehydrogenase (short-subunit alcohol dehydrogenase family)